MNKLILILTFTFSTPLMATELCEVQVCNKLERFSLNIWSHIKDSMGETCWKMQMPKSEARKGRTLDSKSKWYQGSSINPTKKSVTWIKSVGYCKKLI